jgi:transcription initiation factor TFIID subunit TAF12
MGFTDVQMQFNMNQRQQQERQQRQNDTARGRYLALDEIPELYESLEITLPHYA